MRLIACGLFFALIASPLYAAPQCNQRAAVMAHLAEKYGETPRAAGLAANSTVMELLASDETGSWTITVTTPDGMTCLIASGQNFEAMEAPKPGVDG
jgi:hypothetical protein